jgi:cytoskeletal protein RodZ
MSIFCLKKLTSPKRIGEKLKEAREKKNWQIADAVEATHIPKKYLAAIEKGEFQNLPPAKAHCLAYIKKYAMALGLNPKNLISQFDKEAGSENYKPIHPYNNLKIKSIGSIFVWIQKISIALFVIGFIGYLAWQINSILRPPNLTIYNPEEGHVSTQLAILVQGKTDNEVQLNINGKEVITNERGQFETEVDLSKGINTITISAIKKHGKTTVISRHVIVKENNQKDKISLNY